MEAIVKIIETADTVTNKSYIFWDGVDKQKTIVYKNINRIYPSLSTSHISENYTEKYKIKYNRKYL